MSKEKQVIEFKQKKRMNAFNDEALQLCECKFPNIMTGANNDMECCGFCMKDIN